jgi:anti-sigma B factor antagonist
MRIKIQDYDELAVIELQGELTGDFVDILKNTVETAVLKRKPGLVLDMSQIGFVDSKGLEHLLWIREYCNEQSCSFKLAGLTENCSKILELTGLQKEFDRYGELAEAVKSFA